MVTKSQSIRHTVILLFVSGLLLLSSLDKIELHLMEARNFISAREMVQNDEYLLTTLNNQPRYEKPPLPTWLTAVAGMTFGFDSLFAMRLPVVAITMLLIHVFYNFSKILGLEPKHALQNGLILITSFHIFISGRDNQWDMYTHSMMMGSILFLCKLLQEESHPWRNSLLAGLFLGLSILSKGPVSMYALLLPFLISYGIVYHVPFRKKWTYLTGMLISGLLLGASWYVYVRIKDPETFQMIASRETSNWLIYRVKPFYYYWHFFLQSGLWAIPSLIALCYPYLKSRVINIKAYRFALIWTLLGLFLVSVIPEKKDRYLVPVLIPLALTAGFYIEYLFRSFNSGMVKWEKNVVYFSSGFIALIGFAYPFVLIFFLKGKFINHWFLCFSSSLLVIGCAVFIVKGLLKYNFSSIFYSSISLFTVAVIAILPLLDEVVYNPHYASASRARLFEKENNVKSYTLSPLVPQIIWDFGKPVPVLEKKGDRVCLPVEKQFAMIVDLKDSPKLTNIFPQYEIKKIYQININSNKKMEGGLVKDYYFVSKISE
ncbi:MAG: hypothetical protein QUS13_15985 [Smithella sp.]|nr:hypothetical protein [Smithella sp.]